MKRLDESVGFEASQSGNKWRVKVIETGWGSSGYYGADMLAKYGPAVFTEGTKVFMNHPSANEATDRPERDIHQLAGKLVSNAVFNEADQSLYADVQFYSHYAPIIVIAEGAIPQDGDMIVKDQELDAFGHVKLSGIGDWLAKEIEAKTGYETRCTVLGHIQRGGTPTAFDRVLSSRFGLEAITAAHQGDWGTMMALHGTDIVHVPLASATDVLKTVPVSRYEEVFSFFG